MANDFNAMDANDGSLHDAAAAFASMDDGLSDPSPVATRNTGNERNANGQFRGNGGLPEADIYADIQKATQGQGIKQGEIIGAPADDEAEAAEDVSNIDDEFFDVEVERDGKPVRERMKASEVWAKAQDADRLRTEFDDYRRQNVAPEQWDASIMEVHQTRQQLMHQLQIQRQALQPEMPNEDLLNEESPRYNPNLYGRQVSLARAQMQRVAVIENQMNGLKQDEERQTYALNHAQRQRETSKLHQFWPEIADVKEAKKVTEEAVRYWGKHGVTEDLINSIPNSAYLAIVKDAIAFRRGQQAREAAVKVVRAKPKLVRAQARGNANPNQANLNSAMQRLRTTNSIEDAAAAFSALR